MLTIRQVWAIFERSAVASDVSAREIALMKLAFASGISAAGVARCSTRDRVEFLIEAGVDFGPRAECNLEPSIN